MIIKKISRTLGNQSNTAYAHGVLEYITNPEAKEDPDEEFSSPKPEPGKAKRKEKCIKTFSSGFASAETDAKGMALEVGSLAQTVVDGERYKTSSHWILSLDQADKATPDDLVNACQDLVADLGATEQHQYIIAVHDDTNNLHAHILLNRVGQVDGKLLQEGDKWAHKEAQRSGARIAEKYGWSLPDGQKYRTTGEMETVSHENPFTGEEVSRVRPVVQEVPKAELKKGNRKNPKLPQAEHLERKQGIESAPGYIQRKLDDIIPAMEGKKWGHFHKSLAESGIQCKMPESGNFGIVYSMDGKQWYSATDIGGSKEYGLEAMEKTLSSSRFRHAREEKLQPILDAAREQIQADLRLSPAAQESIDKTYSRTEQASLRAIPVEDVRKAFQIDKTGDKRVKNSVDCLVLEGGMSAKQAFQHLDRAFPDVLQSTIVEKQERGIKEIIKENHVPQQLHQTAMDAMREIEGFGCVKFHVYAKTQTYGYSSKVKFPDGMTVDNLMKELPRLAKFNVSGGGIYFKPLHDNKISIMVDDVKDIFLKQYKPNLIIATSDRSKQAHFVLEKKYPDEFYDHLTREINSKFGDPKVTKASHDTRLCGFTNQKKLMLDGSGKYPFAKVESMNPNKDSSFELYVSRMYREWKKQYLDRKNDESWRDKVFSSPKPGSFSVRKEEKKKPERTEYQKKEAQTEAQVAPENLQQQFEEMFNELDFVELDAEFIVKAHMEKERLRKEYEQNLDRSRVDSMLARYLYKQGATENEVYSYMKEYSAQDEKQIQKDGRFIYAPDRRNDSVRERGARRIACNLHPQLEKPIQQEALRRDAEAERQRQAAEAKARQERIEAEKQKRIKALRERMHPQEEISFPKPVMR